MKVSSDAEVPAPPIVEREDLDPSILVRVTPLAALAMLTALLVQSCLTEVPPAPHFDAVQAERQANSAALAALAALRPDAPAEAVVAAVNLGAFRFASGSYDVPAGAQPLLDAAARALVARPDARIVLHGHTDDVGPPGANLALSARRAAAVRDGLVARGVAEERLTTRGHGDTRPVASNATAEGRFLNRRIEFELQL